MEEKICPFCNPENDRTILLDSDDVFAMLDKFPVNNGHTLVIPRRHTANYFDLSPEEQHSCWEMVHAVKNILDKSYAPEGYNIGINIGEAAGQTVAHVHIHLIPRYMGDVEEPRGGVRGVIPGKRGY